MFLASDVCHQAPKASKRKKRPEGRFWLHIEKDRSESVLDASRESLAGLVVTGVRRLVVIHEHCVNVSALGQEGCGLYAK
jgi:hypothetical protein